MSRIIRFFGAGPVPFAMVGCLSPAVAFAVIAGIPDCASEPLGYADGVGNGFDTDAPAPDADASADAAGVAAEPEPEPDETPAGVGTAGSAATGDSPPPRPQAVSVRVKLKARTPTEARRANWMDPPNWPVGFEVVTRKFCRRSDNFA
jgi:hypothetical protein